MKQQEILLLVEKCAHAFSFYDLPTGEQLKSIRLPDFPHEFVVDSAGRYAYVGHYGIETQAHRGEGGCSVFVIDLKLREHVRTLDLWPFRRPHGLAIDAQDRLYVLSEGNSALLVFDHPERDDTPTRAMPSGGYKSHLVALRSDGELAFSLNLLSNTVTMLKPQDPTHTPVAIVPGARPEGNCFSADERLLYVANRESETIVAIDVESLKVVASAKTGTDPTRIYRDRRNRLLVTNYGDDYMSVYSADLEPLGKIQLPSLPIGLSFHPQRDEAYISLKDDRIGVLDLETLGFTRYFNTLREPDVSHVLIA
ncbi:YncE family protein [Pseudoduganella namucuonensis]|uniref:40-residue YVTN family beta-propeller repeat-containing protein n=1 Tax=Pseudoduganella namucuonensis TaxID=1035707 RepID=A0A1I7LTG5_9BURK|nr:YncE family protein [Pseudoduganella namucuonensis]SFV12948.1 40-residue YVTN family beta-propeller repeat-containing protein [Pseudoduganella namucuonensis]